MISKKVEDFLKKNKSKYEAVAHRTVYTAFDAAQTLKVKVHEIVKSLMIKADKDYYLVSLPADKNLDFKLLKKVIELRGGTAKKISFPSEKDITRIFKVKPGTLTGFGALHKTGVIVDKDLKKAKEVIVSAGSLTDSVRMKVAEYLKLGSPTVALVGKKKQLPKQQKQAAKKKPAKKPAKRSRKTRR